MECIVMHNNFYFIGNDQFKDIFTLKFKAGPKLVLVSRPSKYQLCLPTNSVKPFWHFHSWVCITPPVFLDFSRSFISERFQHHPLQSAPTINQYVHVQLLAMNFLFFCLVLWILYNLWTILNFGICFHM